MNFSTLNNSTKLTNSRDEIINRHMKKISQNLPSLETSVISTSSEALFSSRVGGAISLSSFSVGEGLLLSRTGGLGLLFSSVGVSKVSL